jgi:hypothetical protein
MEAIMPCHIIRDIPSKVYNQQLFFKQTSEAWISMENALL